MVGMTAMPEAALAREMQIDYAACAVVANWAAGRGGAVRIEMAEIERTVKSGMDQVLRVLQALVPSL
jgi:5'-methylthioinosine phosphorylase